MAVPTLFAAGALFEAQAGTSITPVIPAGDANDDIGVMVAWCNAASTFTIPAGWILLGTSVNSANMSTAAWWKRLTGADANPTTTTSVTLSTTIGGFGRIYVFRGCLSTADPFEGISNAGTPTLNTLPQTSQVITTAPQRLVCSLLCVDDDNVWSSGMPPAGWANMGGRLFSTFGADAMSDAISQVVPAASTVPVATIGTMSASDYWRTLSFALIPAPAAPVPGSAFLDFGFSATAIGVRTPLTEAPASRAPIPCVLMVETPASWDVHPYYKLTVSISNWGNSTDMAAIDTALANNYPNRTRVVLIAEDSDTSFGRCAAAMNWALRHYDEVMFMGLRTPIIDLKERHDRPVDAVSIENAYGGAAAWLAQMPTWNPAHAHRKDIAAQLLGDRLHIWRDPADTVTPAVTTDALAATMRAQLHTTLGTPADIVPESQDWINQAAWQEMKRLHDYARTSTANEAWKSADGGHTVVLPDGRWASFFSDTGIGVIDADETWGNSGVVRNSMIIHDGNGDITGQYYDPASSPNKVAFYPDQVETPGGFYWPVGSCIDSGFLNIAVMLRVGDIFGDAVDFHILQLDPVTFATQNVISLGEPQMLLQNLIADTDSGYIYCTIANPTRLARVPLGQLHILGSWRYWNGTTWGTDRLALTPIQEDFHGTLRNLRNNEINDGWDIRRYGTGWLAVVRGWWEPYVGVYYSTVPQGPYKFLQFCPTLETSGTRWGHQIYAYTPFWHEMRDPAPDKLMISYNAITLGSDFPIGDRDYYYLDTHFVVCPINRELF